MELTRAFEFVQTQTRRTIEEHPGVYPMYTTGGKWDRTGEKWTHWCEGFFPGIMWLIYGKTREAWWREQAERYSRPLAPRQHDRDVHDLGFVFLSTYLPWFQASGDPALNDVLIQAGRTLALRYQPKGCYLCSFLGPQSLFIDIMMNVGIVFYAAQQTNDAALRDIAMQHCYTSRRYLIRGDGSTAHEAIFDTNTGECLRCSTQQGWRADSCWSRGLAWALYGFHTAYQYSGDEKFMEAARLCGLFYTKNTPELVPPWDYDAPAEQRVILDTSAAAIAAAGLIRQNRANVARRTVQRLCDEFLVKEGDDGVLSHGVYHMHKGLAVSEAVIWGDYFFTEALTALL